MNIIVVGGGKKVRFLAKSFFSKGYDVTVINNDAEFCKELARKYNIKIVNGDGTKSYILKDAGAASSDVVIALTPKDQDNLVICQLSSMVFGVAKTFSVVNDPRNIEIFKKLGVNTIISTASMISSLIEQKVFVDQITNLIPLEEGKVAVMELEVERDYPIANKSLKNADIPDKAIIGCIIREGSPIIPKGETMMQPQDKLIVLSLPSVQSEVLAAITGRKG